MGLLKKIYSKIHTILPIFGIILLIYILSGTDSSKLFSVLAGAEIYYILIAFLFIASHFIVKSFRWIFILKRQGINLPFTLALKYILASFFYESITPAKVGTFIRADYLRKNNNIPFGKANASIVTEKMLDLLVLFIFATIGILLFMDFLFGLLFYSIFFLAIILALCIFILRKNLNYRFFGFIYHSFLPDSMKGKAKNFYNSFYEHQLRKRDLLMVFIVTIIIWFLIYTQAFFIAKAVSIEIPYLYFVFIFSIATIVGLLPISVSGLGTREAALVFLFGFFLIAAEEIIVISLSSFFIATIIPAIVGFLISINLRKNVGIVSEKQV